MTVSNRRWSLLLLNLGFMVGCSGEKKLNPPPRTLTGAEECAKTYFEALVQKDWSAAYQALDEKSRENCSKDQFIGRARIFYQDLGFEPDSVRVLACDEHGDEAIAHVNFKGIAGSSPKFYKDAAPLKRGPKGWAVVLPEYFGKPKKTKKS